MANGWISEPVCSTHDCVPLSDEEHQEMEDGWDPCLFVVRLYEST